MKSFLFIIKPLQVEGQQLSIQFEINPPTINKTKKTKNKNHVYIQILT